MVVGNKNNKTHVSVFIATVLSSKEYVKKKTSRGKKKLKEKKPKKDNNIFQYGDVLENFWMMDKREKDL